MRPLSQGRVFCCLLVLSGSSNVVWHIVWQQFAFRYEQNAHMCDTHTCHKFFKTFIVKEEFNLQSELLEVSGERKLYFQDPVILGTLVWKDYQSTRGSSYLMYLRQRQRMSINRTRKLTTYGIQGWQNLHSNSAVFKQGCSITSMTYFFNLCWVCTIHT